MREGLAGRPARVHRQRVGQHQRLRDRPRRRPQRRRQHRAAPSPRDLDFAGDGRFLYAVSPGNATTPAAVSGYRVGADGSLTQITSVPAATGITGAAAS
jgi:hypothetical protein